MIVDFTKNFPEADYETDWRRIVKLDSMDLPGLSQKEFFGLFATCDTCGFVVARQVFHKHRCNPAVPA